jgi:hypothetical protein
MKHTVIEALEHQHLTPYNLLIPLGHTSWHGLQYDLACDVPCQRQSGENARGVEGERRVGGGDGGGRCGS